MAHILFPGFLRPVLTQLFFPKPPTAFLTCFCRGEQRNYATKKVCLNQGLNSEPPGHESDTLTTEPSGQGTDIQTQKQWKQYHDSSPAGLWPVELKQSNENLKRMFFFQKCLPNS